MGKLALVALLMLALAVAAVKDVEAAEDEEERGYGRGVSHHYHGFRGYRHAQGRPLEFRS